MSVPSISSSPSTPPAPKTRPAEATEATQGGKDIKNDGDSDDGGAAAQASAPKPVINLQGQTLGQTVNVTA
jgi:hypothetical protein